MDRSTHLRWLLAVVLTACAVPMAFSAADIQGNPTPETKSFRLYTVNQESGEISVIDCQNKAVLETIFIGVRLNGLAAAPHNDYAYLAMDGIATAPGWTNSLRPPSKQQPVHGIGRFSLRTGKLDAAISLSPAVEHLIVSEDGKRLFVAQKEQHALAIVAFEPDAFESHTIDTSITVGDVISDMALSPNGNFVYILSSKAETVSVVDTRSDNVIAVFDTGSNPHALAFSADGNFAYVTNRDDASVTIVDTQSHTPVGTISLPNPKQKPMLIVASPNSHELHITLNNHPELITLNTQKHTVVQRIAMHSPASALTISPDGNTIFTSHPESNTINAFDAKSLTHTHTIPVGKKPTAMVIVPQ